jgi:hypothetical protein
MLRFMATSASESWHDLEDLPLRPLPPCESVACRPAAAPASDRSTRGSRQPELGAQGSLLVPMRHCILRFPAAPGRNNSAAVSPTLQVRVLVQWIAACECVQNSDLPSGCNLVDSTVRGRGRESFTGLGGAVDVAVPKRLPQTAQKAVNQGDR